ncbi:MAG: hypothetical protein LBS55_03565, partial [Prevotellaceae bacterium]|nr:hypothetical protein [Prevotellaceae bacterium]
FDRFSGGFNVYHKEHHFSKKGGGGKAEMTVGKMLAQYNGKQVEFLSESGNKAADLRFDGQTWDIKYINNANTKTIRSYIEDIRRKGADNGIFYWDRINQLRELVDSMSSEIGKLSKSGRINEMPDIYYMEKSGILRTLWKK